jgi:methionyl-tRNA formyltransferase
MFFGSGGFGAPSLERLREHPEVELVGVVTAPARAAGRGGRLTPTAIETLAGELGIEPVLTPARLRSPDSIAAVMALQPDLAILADYGQLMPVPILGLGSGALNLHPSLLPRHRGATPIQGAVLAGDAETGVTLFRMDEGLDTGPILASQRIALNGDETTPELERHLSELAADLLDDALGPWLRGDLTALPQEEERATMTRPLRREDGRLNLERSASELERQVRAYQPWPGSFVETPVGRLQVWRARTAPPEPGDRPGRLVAGGRDIALAAAAGRLVLEEVQPAGGRRMSTAELLRGRGRALADGAQVALDKGG